MKPRPIPTRVALGAVLRDARRRAGLSQQELADRTGLAQPTVSHIERGTSDVRLETLFRVLATLGLELVIDSRTSRATAGPWGEEG